MSGDEMVGDFGTGTGEFPLTVADYCDRVISVDVSETILKVSREKLARQDINNGEILHDGFVSYDH